MKPSWTVNIVLLIIVLIGGFYAWNSSRQDPVDDSRIEISSLKLSDFSEINIEFPSRQPTQFKLTEQGWRMMKPYQARADELYVYRVLGILATTSPVKLPANDLEKYGLEKPELKITFANKVEEVTFLFGTYNPVNEDQYILYNNHVYLISGGFSETATFQPLELIDKNPIARFEKIKSFDFSRLEQWQENRLRVNKDYTNWSVQGDNVAADSKQMDEWYEITWEKLAATSVEPYKMDPRIGYRSFDILFENGKKVTFYRIQESPELTLYRKDEGLLYHFPGDLGFTMLNPHVIIKENSD